ncbi:MAG: 6-phosphofructokinase [Deltaproteobacteria bacterium RBG_16_44_11]|nr:MAG: 6-phosphofructokinase [Deltaproteobacteria bacterium RBG_16_44_11]
MNDEKLYLVLMGLPARGKSTLAIRLQEAFRKSRIPTKIFNNGNLRRAYLPLKETSSANFYHPENISGIEMRKKFALINMKRAKTYLAGPGQVAILDAANVSRERRKMIEENLDNHPILFIECVNDDQEILTLSILEKTNLPEFSLLNRQRAQAEFLKRIDNYRMIYTPLKAERNYFRLDSLQNKILEEKQSDPMPLYLLIKDILITDVVKNLFLIRHAETKFNTIDRIGGDSTLTAKGIFQAKALGRFFKKRQISYIFTSHKKRTIQTARAICAMQKDCKIIPIREFDEINAGICEGMTYKDIEKNFPDVFNARKTNKYHYVYPQGESYETMKPRIEAGIKKAFFLNRHADNIMIIGHQAVNRMILAHFLYRRDVDVPYIYIPQDEFYHIVSMQNKKLFELKPYT